ncbi:MULTISPECIES: hypothetical protein [unclassified Streptomyces]|uniref:hypothetical protein n=1 Tax=unclassified Streptomyces TaxID=2593676 RepID=UPI00344CF156
MLPSRAIPSARPPRLRPGSRVAVVAPSGPVPADRLEAGLDVLRGWGVEPVVAPHVHDSHGGCVSLLAALTGTPHARTGARGGPLVIEDTGEEPCRLDGILTRLPRSGALEGLSGVVCGLWQECGPYEKIRAVLADRFGPLGIPVIEELGFGHGPTSLTVPLGVEAVLNAPAGGGRCTLTLKAPGLL